MNPIRTVRRVRRGRARRARRRAGAGRLRQAGAARGAAPPTAPTATAPTATAPQPPPRPPPEHAEAGIAWRQAANDAEVDAAFASARSENKPVFVYWGAKWCPPCNQVKATLFNRQDFIERSRAFVPVYVDGDSPGAQKIGARFKVSGYPTMVLFTPAGPGGDAPARRGRAGPLHRGAHPRHERGAAGQRGARRRARQAGDADAPTTGACSPSIRGTPTTSR